MHGKPWYACLVAAADVNAAANETKHSIMELFEAGRLAPGRCDPARPYESFLKWMRDADSLRQAGLLRAFVIERPPQPDYPYEILVGRILKEMRIVNDTTYESVSLKDARDAIRQVEERLAEWKVFPKVGLHAVFSVEGEEGLSAWV